MELRVVNGCKGTGSDTLPTNKKAARKGAADLSAPASQCDAALHSWRAHQL
jgi:hypothetical protein